MSILREAVLHVPLSQYAYATDENHVTLRLRTKKGNVETCYVFIGDRVAMTEPIPVAEWKMERVASDDLYDYFEVVIPTEFTRVCYYFWLQASDERLYYYTRGFCERMDAHRTEYFQFPFIRREEVLHKPEWVHDAVMYHIFPDSFANDVGRLQPCQTTVGRSVNRLGGTLRGITQNLDYLESLGVNLIYLNPIFRANSYHKYDTIDYYAIDPCLGTDADFRELVEAVHARGMRIILDGVFNHCGPDFFAFADVLEKGKESSYVDWFYDLSFPLQYQDPPNYECFAYVKEMPKLNTSNPAVRDYICQVGRYWIREYGIDGWRLDVANEVDHDTWRAFRKVVLDERPDAFLIGEIWEDAECWLRGDQFDSAMNYMFSYLCRDFFAKRCIGVQEFDEQIQKSLMRYPWPVTQVQMNFLDSHDVARFLSHCEDDGRRLQLACFFLLMFPGVPSIFYGDECFITGETEDEYRAAMPWNRVDNDFVTHLREWIALRKSSKALTRGDYRSVYYDDALYVFCRRYEDEQVYVVINYGQADVDVSSRENLSFLGDVRVPAMAGVCIRVDHGGS